MTSLENGIMRKWRGMLGGYAKGVNYRNNIESEVKFNAGFDSHFPMVHIHPAYQITFLRMKWIFWIQFFFWGMKIFMLANAKNFSYFLIWISTAKNICLISGSISWEINCQIPRRRVKRIQDLFDLIFVF